MSPSIVISVIVGYFALLITISWYTSRDANSATFFNANRKSPWYLVAFGMIGTILSGATFISVPGWVKTSQFSYMQMALGFFVAYPIIALVLMPIYYKLNLTSIYGYLKERFGFRTYKTGASFFILSRSIGASFRLFLVARVLQIALFDHWGIPFWVSVLTTIILIWVYTFRGGIKTIVWTDTLQTLFLLSSLFVSIVVISKDLHFDFTTLASTISSSEYSQVFFWDIHHKNSFYKMFVSGLLIGITMTGLDQDMMQKNLTCKNLKEAQRNIFSYSGILIVVNFLFLCLGALLYIYADKNGIVLPEKSDDVFPTLIFDYFGIIPGIFFLLGITAAAYSSADSALTSLTTSYCIDILNIDVDDDSSKKKRLRVHIGFSILLFIIVMVYQSIDNENIVISLFKAAGYTYGPILGLYTVGLFSNINIKDRFAPIVCIASPILCYILDTQSQTLLGGFEFGFLILPVNALITALGLVIIQQSKKSISH